MKTKKRTPVLVEATTYREMSEYASLYGLTVPELVSRMWVLWQGMEKARDSIMPTFPPLQEPLDTFLDEMERQSMSIDTEDEDEDEKPITSDELRDSQDIYTIVETNGTFQAKTLDVGHTQASIYPTRRNKRDALKDVGDLLAYTRLDTDLFDMEVTRRQHRQDEQV